MQGLRVTGFRIVFSLLCVAGLSSHQVQGQLPVPPSYPRMAAYLGVLHPLATVSQGKVETNFGHYYAVGFPIGLNLWKTAKIGFSVEIVPTIRAEKSCQSSIKRAVSSGYSS